MNDPILPVRVRTCTEPFARTRRKAGYAASVEGRPTATEGPGKWESGRCRVSASGVCHVPGLTEALRMSHLVTLWALVAQDIRLLALHVRGVWRCHLDKMADGVDR